MSGLGNATCSGCGRSHRVEGMTYKRAEECDPQPSHPGQYIKLCRSCDKKHTIARQRLIAEREADRRTRRRRKVAA